MIFDAEKFATGVLTCLRPLVPAEATSELDELAKDVEATLAALEVERDRRRATALVHDLERFLPRRTAVICDLAGKSLARLDHEQLVEATVFACRATLITARAFL